jgi:hypothetical protein
MEQRIFEYNGQKVAEIISDQIEISNVQDALDLMANADYEGARNMVICEKNFCPDFFDLKTGLAGEILQKYANYHMKLSIVGDFAKYNSNSLNAFIIECNRGRHIFFTLDIDTAVQKMTNWQIT